MTQIDRRIPWGSKKTSTISPTSSKVIESIALTNFQVIYYFVLFYNATNDITKEMKVTVKRSGSEVTSTVTNRIGIGMDLAVDPQVNGSNFEMKITNNEAYNLEMSFSRLTL